jgi:phospholipid/cholesterol/gamma-HCH transport system substrate-binding protein
MAKPFKFRYANELAGGFVLLTLLVVALAAVVSGKARGWFSRTVRVSVVLPAGGSMGLRAGADVQILGTAQAGTVTEILPPDEAGRMQAVLDLRPEYAKFVRQDSKVLIRKAAMIGAAYVEVSRGTGAELPAEAALLTVDADAADVGPDKLIAELRAEVLPAIRQLREAAEQYTALARDLRSPEGNLQQAVARFNRVAERAEKGDGLVARLLNDPQLAESLSASGPRLAASLEESTTLLKTLNKTAVVLPDLAATATEEVKRLPALMQQTQAALAEVQRVLKDLERTTGQLPDTVKSINRTVEGLPSLLVQSQETLRQMQRLIEGAQRSWILRGSMDDGTPAGRIAPGRVSGGGATR